MSTTLKQLPEGYKIRPMEPTDYSVLKILEVLTTVGSIGEEQFSLQVEEWKLNDRIYNPLVVTNNNDDVVACGMLFVEFKLIHELGKVGHIEDIAVRSDQQGLQLGKHLILALTEIARSKGCYKVILDCDEKNVGFYQKCGYSVAGVEMSIRFDK